MIVFSVQPSYVCVGPKMQVRSRKGGVQETSCCTVSFSGLNHSLIIANAFLRLTVVVRIDR